MRGPGVVVAVFGPTAGGKTPLAVELSALLGVRVISCDSMQLYRGFPVLTNQPTVAEVTAAPHEMVAVADPGDEWTAGRYAAAAQPLIDADLAAHGWALVVGGTGLYLRAALAPLAMPAPGDPMVRARLRERGVEEGSVALHAELATLDPAAAAAIHPHNLHRVLRALEVVTLEGPGRWSGRSDLWVPEYRHPTLVVGLTIDGTVLSQRIEGRSRRMLTEGAVEEVQRHRLGGGGTTRDAAAITHAIGYREICTELDGRATHAQTEVALAAATRQYARRQLTWMRRLEDAVIMDSRAVPSAELAHRIEIMARERHAAALIPPSGGTV
jgi:tRNA dimethylallyltransferase